MSADNQRVSSASIEPVLTDPVTGTQSTFGGYMDGNEAALLMQRLQAMGPMVCDAARKNQDKQAPTPSIDYKDYRRQQEQMLSLFDPKKFQVSQLSPGGTPTLNGVAQDLSELQMKFNLLFDGLQRFLSQGFRTR